MLLRKQWISGGTRHTSTTGVEAITHRSKRHGIQPNPTKAHFLNHSNSTENAKTIPTIHGSLSYLSKSPIIRLPDLSSPICEGGVHIIYPSLLQIFTFHIDTFVLVTVHRTGRFEGRMTSRAFQYLVEKPRDFSFNVYYADHTLNQAVGIRAVRCDSEGGN